MTAKNVPEMNAVPVGYKQTEVGVIPEDWDVLLLKDLLKEPPKYGVNAPAVPLEGVLPVYIRITDISENGSFRPSERVGVRIPFSDHYHLHDGDIVLARTGASVGKSYLYRKEDGVLVYAGFLIKVSPDPKRLKSEFLFQYLHTQCYWSWVIVNSMRSGQPGINGNEYGNLPVPCPKLQEQTAIANALSDVDALLSELEKLIAKKQAIKTATMQQLLTGRTRLPQFALREDGTPKGTKQSELGEMPEDWEIKCFSQLATVKSGGTPSTINKECWDGNVNWCTPTDITALDGQKYLSNTSRKITEAGVAKSAAYLLPVGTVVMTSRATIGECAITTVDMTTNQGFKNFLCGCELYNEFLFYLLTSLKESFISLCSGSTFLEISTTQVRNFDVVLPCIKEQTAIATILSDMDEEIQALEHRLSKARQVKQGMMQQLLTGKTRLVTGAAGEIGNAG